MNIKEKGLFSGVRKKKKLLQKREKGRGKGGKKTRGA